jgi:acetylglutamate kinase
MKEKVTIVKVGGAVVEDEAKLAQLLKDFSAIPGSQGLGTRRWPAEPQR